MKRKNVIAAILTLVAVSVLAISSVIYGMSFWSPDAISLEAEVEQMERRLINEIDVRRTEFAMKNIEYSASAAIQNVYLPYDFRILMINPVGELHDSFFAPRTLSQVNNLFPFEFIEKVSDDLVYVVYRIYDDGLEYFKYLFFSRETRFDAARSRNSAYDSWMLTGPSFSISRMLERADFAEIKVGSTIMDIAEIEPLALRRKPLNFIGEQVVEQFDFELEKYVDYVIPPPLYIEYTDAFYLKDGILVVLLSKPNNPLEVFTVTNIMFIDNFRIPLTGITLEISYKDFPSFEQVD